MIDWRWFAHPRTVAGYQCPGGENTLVQDADLPQQRKYDET
jgi:hypothetical protein